MAEKIYGDLQTLSPGDRVILYELDSRPIGGDLAYFHGHDQAEPIWWKGIEYSPWPIQVEGFSLSGESQQAQPTLRVGDVDRVITVLCRMYNDLVFSKVTRRQTLVRFLDAQNFPDGNPEADPNESLPDEVFYIDQKAEQVAGRYVTFSLKSAMDLTGTYCPSRQMVANVCQWKVIGGYRGPYCAYTGSRMFDKDNNPVTDPALDDCAGLLSSCELRFGKNEPKTFGSFPAARLYRQ